MVDNSLETCLDPAASRTIRGRRRNFSSQTLRKPLAGRSLLLQDSDEDEDPNDRTVGRRSASTSCTTQSFQDIISSLEDPALGSGYPETIRNAISHANRSGLPPTNPRRARSQRQMSNSRLDTKNLPTLPDCHLHVESPREHPRRHSAASAASLRNSYRRSFGSPALSPAPHASFVSLVETDGLSLEDLEILRLLKRRQAILRELVLTEISFSEDLAIVVEEYQHKTFDCSALDPDDARQIFDGVEPVMAFSRDFALDLRIGASAILFSEATSLEVLHLEDAQTVIGTVFGQFMNRLSKVFSRYCSTHERAAACLQKVSQDPAVQSWLSERHPTDRTTAWDLPSLLIKPVQRVLKYPLLLSSLLEATSKSHADYYAIEIALKEMLLTADNINNVKTRRDLVDSIAAANKKRGDFGGIAKTFTRRTAKLKQHAGLDEDLYQATDAVYDGLVGKFRAQQDVLQSLQADVQDWLSAMTSSLEYHAGLSAAFHEVAQTQDAPPSRFPPAIEWEEYPTAVSDLQQGALIELTHNLEREVFQPISVLEAAYKNPALIMAERDRRLEDFHRNRIAKSKGVTLDRSSVESADQFTQLNDTLIQELPIFLDTAMKAMTLITGGLLSVQKSWYHSWSLRLGTLIAPDSDPTDLLQNFRDRQIIMSVHIAELSLTNGTLATNPRLESDTRSSEDSSLLSEASSRVAGATSRPSIRLRAMSVANNASVSLKGLSLRNTSNSSVANSRSPRSSYHNTSQE